MKTAEAARVVGVNRRTVARWIEAGQLKAARGMDGGWIINPADIRPFTRLFTIREAAQVLHASRRTVYRMIERGELKTRKLGGTQYIDLKEVKNDTERS